MPNPDGTYTQDELTQLLAQATSANQSRDVPISPAMQANVDKVYAGALARNDLPNRGLAGLPPQPPQQSAIMALLSRFLPSTKEIAGNAKPAADDRIARQQWAIEHPGEPFPEAPAQ